MSSNKSEDQDQSMNIQKLNELNAQLDSELNKYKQMIGNVNNNNNNNNNNFARKMNFSTNQNSDLNMNANKSFLMGAYPKFTETNSNIALNNLNNNNNRASLENNMNSNNNNNNALRYNDYYYANQSNSASMEFPRIASLEPRFLDNKMNFLEKESSTPLCIRREGMLKIRDADQKDKDVVVTYAVLTKDRLSYFVNPKDESSIQGSIELDKIRESLKLINGFASCFTVKTLDNISDCSICAESEDSAREWINAITQNAVNCNTLSALNNLNKRGLLK